MTAGSARTAAPGPAAAVPGLKVGLEIHQQLATGKLFCRCPTDLTETVEQRFVRRLRPTRSELGHVDAAALEEAMRARLFTYEGDAATACLVEADEEPPHALNPGALDVVLTFCLLTDARPVDEVHTMRKIVIDGSNTAGFQRTCLVALGGRIETASGPVGLQTTCLEEDACRVVERTGGAAVYRLDRLGIPLVEVATEPTITSGAQAREVALALGRILRATGKAKRGLGTIRQDLNVSVPEGARVEVKGVQELDLIPTVVENEATRQRILAGRARELRERGVRSDAIPRAPIDVTGVFKASQCGLVRKALDAGGAVLGIPLAGFAGLLGTKADGPARLGAELAGHARARGASGLLHSDELPAYGVTEVEVAAARAALDARGARDAFALVVGDRATGTRALEAVAARAAAAIAGVPEETREALPDGSTRYLRPLPGSARMYPETDVPPCPVARSLLDALRARLPEMPEAKAARFVREHGLPKDQADQLALHPAVPLYEALVAATGLQREAARVVLQTMPELERAGVDLPDALVTAAFEALRSGAFAKEALPQVLEQAARRRVSVAQAAEALGLGAVDEGAVRAVARQVVEANAALVKEKGERAAGPLMGDVMKRLRGKADGKLVSRVLAEEIRRVH